MKLIGMVGLAQANSSSCSTSNAAILDGSEAGSVHDHIRATTSDSCSNSIHESTVDIASSPQEGPVQPVSYSFPSTVIGTKGRCFNSKWYEQYEWIEYSIAKDAVFCFPCRFFAHATNNAEDRFVNLGFRDWKHAGGKSGAFASCKTHQEALIDWSQYKKSVATGTSIASKLDNARREQIKKNRHYLKALIHSLMFCATQECSTWSQRNSIINQQRQFSRACKSARHI